MALLLLSDLGLDNRQRARLSRIRGVAASRTVTTPSRARRRMTLPALEDITSTTMYDYKDLLHEVPVDRSSVEWAITKAVGVQMEID